MSTIRYTLPECVCPKVTNQYIVLGALDTQHQQGLIKQIASEREDATQVSSNYWPPTALLQK